MFSTSPPISIEVLVLPGGVDLSHVGEVVFTLVLHVGPPHGSKGVLPLTIAALPTLAAWTMATKNQSPAARRSRGAKRTDDVFTPNMSEAK